MSKKSKLVDPSMSGRSVRRMLRSKKSRSPSALRSEGHAMGR